MLNFEYPPLGGGQGNANKFIFEILNRDYPTLQVDIVTSSVDKERIEKYSVGDIHFLDIGKHNKSLHSQGIKDLIVSSWKTFWRASKLIRKNRYGLIIGWSGIPAGFIAYFLKLFHGIPFVTLLRGADVPFYEERWKKLDKYLFQYLSPFLWRKSVKVIANSTLLRDLAYKVSKKTEIDIITNGIDVNFFSPPECRDFEGKKIILGVGRLIERKGFDILIKAAGKYAQKNNDFNFEIWLVGDGPEKEKLMQLAKEYGIENQLNMLGIKDKNELQKIYKEAHIFCLPSYNEGMSNAVLEAISTGLPALVTNVGGSEELIHNNGYIFATGDTLALQNLLGKLFNDNKLLVLMSDESRKIANELSWEKITAKFVHCFEQNYKYK